jgi:hypothetical protein
LNPSEDENGFDVPAVFMYLKMRGPLAFKWFDGFFSYSVFKSAFVLGLCPLNMNILVPKIGALQGVAVKQNGNVTL